MASHQLIGFHEALEVVESLSYSQQEELIEVIRHRLAEHKRATVAHNIRASRKEYSSGEAKTGTIDDLMKEIDR